MKKEVADKILNETEVGYDLISHKFSETRKYFWRGLEHVVDYTREGENVLDFGCGNGRLLYLLGGQNIKYWGLDISEKLIEIAKNKHVGDDKHFRKIDPIQTTLAFNDDFFNTVYSIAVFHHFPSKKYRQDLANELYRVTSDGGHIVITVWYLWQKKYFGNIMQNWFGKIKGNSVFDCNDCEISFTDNSGRKFQRFHHAFTKKELRKLFENAGFKIEKCEVIDGRNILLVGKKLQLR